LKYLIEKLVRDALGALPEDLRPADTSTGIVVERTRDPSHGDFATNVALQLAKAAKRKPRDLAQAIVTALPESDLVAKVEIAGPGFINFFMTPAAYQAELLRAVDLGRAYGRSTIGGGKKVMVEFVSANPTGPLHVGHGRHAAFGASLANLLDAIGCNVYREYYINDAGRQMDILAASVWLRYLESFGEQFPFPSNGYRGDYIRPIADKLVERAAARCCNLRPPSSRTCRWTRRPVTRTCTSMPSSRARVRCSARPASGRRSTLRSVTSSPTSATTWKNSASATTAGSANAASRTMARSTTHWTCCARTAWSMRKTARNGSVRRISATRRIASWCVRTA